MCMFHVSGLGIHSPVLALAAMCEEGEGDAGSRTSVPALVPQWQEKGTV